MAVPYLATEEHRSIYYEHHAGEGRPVLLAHGWGMSGRIWDGVVAALVENGNEIVVFDHRCCGRSDKDFREVSVAATGEDIVKLVEHLGLEEPGAEWVVARRRGVRPCRRQARRQGRRAVWTCGATPRFIEAPDWPYAQTAEAAEGTLAALRDARVDTLWDVSEAVRTVDVGEHVTRWMWDMFLQTSPRADEALRSLGEVEQRDAMRELTLPVLLLAGRQDVFTWYDSIEASLELLQNGPLSRVRRLRARAVPRGLPALQAGVPRVRQRSVTSALPRATSRYSLSASGFASAPWR